MPSTEDSIPSVHLPPTSEEEGEESATSTSPSTVLHRRGGSTRSKHYSDDGHHLGSFSGFARDEESTGGASGGAGGGGGENEVGSAFSRFSNGSADVGGARVVPEQSILRGVGMSARRFSQTAHTFAPASFSATSSSIRSSAARFAELANKPSDYQTSATSFSPTPRSFHHPASFSHPAKAVPSVPHHPFSTGTVPTLSTQQESPPSRSYGGPSALSVMLAQADVEGGSSGQPSAQSTRPNSLKETKHDEPSSKKHQDVAFSPGRTPTPASLHSAISLERGSPIETYSSSVTPKASVIQLARAHSEEDEPEHDHDEPSDEIHPAWRSTSSLPLDDESSPTLAHDERSPLLSKHSTSSAGVNGRPGGGEIEEFSKPRSTIWSRLVQHVPNSKDFHRPTGKEVYQHAVVEPVKVIPAVVLGLLLNILDGVSYGMITFPANLIFTDFGSIGVSMFFMSCIISQLTYTLGGSIFKGGNGSMMIEAVPFFHIIVGVITAKVGEDKPDVVIATTMVSFAFSAILTGIVFMVLGRFRLGVLVGFFPRHILVGCIGGVGVFLIETGLEVAAGIEGEGIKLDHETFVALFGSFHQIALWSTPLLLALTFRLINMRWNHELVLPIYFLVIPVLFYIVIAIIGVDFPTLRNTGWVFDVGEVSKPWYTFYTLFDFKLTDWDAFWACFPTQLALVFFGILHVPLNVPSLGVSLNEDNVKLDRELVAHGFSNMLAGCFGTVPNYLCYVNTVLFYRVGGGSRLSGMLLAAATAGVMLIGPSAIGYLPVMVVGALIFVLGLDLVKEALWDTRNKVSHYEYVVILAIVFGMTVWDFVQGLLGGIVLACIFFVVQSSKRSAIRSVFNGVDARSTVRRPQVQTQYLKRSGQNTQVLKLQGFLFFGTVSAVEDRIRHLLATEASMSFLIVDMSFVNDLDFSAAEAFVRIHRLLTAKRVILVFCGVVLGSQSHKALRSVGLWGGEENSTVWTFDSLNAALEWTENEYLTLFYQNRAPKEEAKARNVPTSHVASYGQGETFENSPRRKYLTEAGDAVMASEHARYQPLQLTVPHPETVELAAPLPILRRTFSSYTSQEIDFWFELAPYFQSQHVYAGEAVWNQGDDADALYVIESGELQATYIYADHVQQVFEVMLAATVAGELSMMSRTKRNATVVAGQSSHLWKLDVDSWDRLESEKPAIAREFTRILLRITAEESDVLSAHLLAVLS
ncbi:sulfate transporter family-domain-containing protein [Mrakia frigida]|uniref:Vsb1p n=1 Tax=Mrakia frigida TaxID=29902 RepID=UPI003FCC220F